MLHRLPCSPAMLCTAIAQQGVRYVKSSSVVCFPARDVVRNFNCLRALTRKATWREVILGSVVYGHVLGGWRSNLRCFLVPLACRDQVGARTRGSSQNSLLARCLREALTLNRRQKFATSPTPQPRFHDEAKAKGQSSIEPGMRGVIIEPAVSGIGEN